MGRLWSVTVFGILAAARIHNHDQVVAHAGEHAIFAPLCEACAGNLAKNDLADQ